jgi:hypothetical protein
VREIVQRAENFFPALLRSARKDNTVTQQVYWPHEQASRANEKVEVTIIAWDYEAKRGTAMLHGGHIAEVRQVTTLTIVSESEQK